MMKNALTLLSILIVSYVGSAGAQSPYRYDLPPSPAEVQSQCAADKAALEQEAQSTANRIAKQKRTQVTSVNYAKETDQCPSASYFRLFFDDGLKCIIYVVTPESLRGSVTTYDTKTNRVIPFKFKAATFGAPDCAYAKQGSAADDGNLVQQASFEKNRFGGGLCKSFIHPIRREPGYLCTSNGEEFFGFNRTQDCYDYCP